MKEFWDSLTKEQQSTLAASVGSTTGYPALCDAGYRYGPGRDSAAGDW